MSRRFHWKDAVLALQRAVPLVLVSLAAAGTWWWVQSGPATQRASTPSLASSLPDLVLHRAEVERFDAAGRLVTIVRGERMQQFNTADLLVVDDMDMTLLDVRGHTVLARARQGTLSQQQDHLLLQGRVQVDDLAPRAPRSQALVFLGEELEADDRTQVLTSRLPVTVRSPRGQVQGSSLRHDLTALTTDFGGRVQGRLEAAAVPLP